MSEDRSWDFLPKIIEDVYKLPKETQDRIVSIGKNLMQYGFSYVHENKIEKKKTKELSKKQQVQQSR